MRRGRGGDEGREWEVGGVAREGSSQRTVAGGADGRKEHLLGKRSE